MKEADHTAPCIVWFDLYEMSRICKSIETESRSVVLVAGELAITGLKKKVSVAQSCLTFCNSMDCNQPGSSVHGILQVRILEWVAIPFPTQGLDPGILHCREILYCLSHQGSTKSTVVGNHSLLQGIFCEGWGIIGLGVQISSGIMKIF